MGPRRAKIGSEASPAGVCPSFLVKLFKQCVALTVRRDRDRDLVIFFESISNDQRTALLLGFSFAGPDLVGSHPRPRIGTRLRPQIESRPRPRKESDPSASHRITAPRDGARFIASARVSRRRVSRRSSRGPNIGSRARRASVPARPNRRDGQRGAGSTRQRSAGKASEDKRRQRSEQNGQQSQQSQQASKASKKASEASEASKPSNTLNRQGRSAAKAVLRGQWRR